MQSFIENTYLVLIIMIFAGWFGGSVNYYQTYSKKEDGGVRKYWTCVIIGLAASLLVPLFLKMISSNLINCDNKDCPKALDYLVFLGICLIASIFSRRFIDSIADKILRKVEEADKKADEAKEDIEKANESRDAIIQAINQYIAPLLEKSKKEDDGNNT